MTILYQIAAFPFPACLQTSFFLLSSHVFPHLWKVCFASKIVFNLKNLANFGLLSTLTTQLEYVVYSWKKERTRQFTFITNRHLSISHITIFKQHCPYNYCVNLVCLTNWKLRRENRKTFENNYVWIGKLIMKASQRNIFVEKRIASACLSLW